MDTFVKSRQLLLAGGDVLVLYISLALTLITRTYLPLNNNAINNVFVQEHVQLFTLIFFVWITIYFISGLYELRHLKNNFEFLKRIGTATLINAGIAILILYFIPNSVIEPKTNLVLLLVISTIMMSLWRQAHNHIIRTTIPATKILLIGNNQTTQEITAHLTLNPQLGYTVKHHISDGLEKISDVELKKIIVHKKIDLIAIPRDIKKNSQASHSIYQTLQLGVAITDLASLYANIFNKVPLVELEEAWFLEKLIASHTFYDYIKKTIDIVLAICISVITLPVGIIIAIMIRLTSRGPALFKQTRVGKFEQEFTLYKFRTMAMNAERDGAQWSQPNDNRITHLGKILRHTHLDELPQLINIFRGELSFSGPRPERPIFVTQLKKEIPYYELRHIVHPGLTGWAQLNYHYGASVQDAYEKLQYDIFYLKNRSLWLDIGIIIKTAKLFFIKL